MSTQLNIFEFTRFRRYLAEYQERRFQADPDFTRTEFCRQLGLPNTRSYFNDVIQGKRVSKEMRKRFLHVLHLQKQESLYFLAMIDFDQAKTAEARSAAFAEMQRIHPNPKSILDPDSFDYYSRWYHSVIFSILDVADIGDNPEELQSQIKPPLSKSNIRDSLELLNRLKLIRKNEQGFWKPTRDRISSGPHSQELLIRQYQIQCLDLSRQTLESSPNPAEDPSQDMTTMTFSISEQASVELQKELEQFRRRIVDIVAQDNNQASQVLHLNMHLSNLLQKVEKP